VRSAIIRVSVFPERVPDLRTTTSWCPADFGDVGEEGESSPEEDSHRDREGSGFYQSKE
jgi:hypothetical protein